MYSQSLGVAPDSDAIDGKASKHDATNREETKAKQEGDTKREAWIQAEGFGKDARDVAPDGDEFVCSSRLGVELGQLNKEMKESSI